MKRSEETNVTFTLLALVVDSTKLEIHWNEKFPGIWFELKGGIAGPDAPKMQALPKLG